MIQTHHLSLFGLYPSEHHQARFDSLFLWNSNPAPNMRSYRAQGMRSNPTPSMKSLRNAVFDFPDVVRALLVAGANTETVGEKGWTSLMAAAAEGDQIYVDLAGAAAAAAAAEEHRSSRLSQDRTE